MIIRTKLKEYIVSNVLTLSLCIVLLLFFSVTVYQASEYQREYYKEIETTEIGLAKTKDGEVIVDENGNVIRMGGKKTSSNSNTNSDSSADGTLDESSDSRSGSSTTSDSSKVLLAMGDSITNANTPNAEMMGDNKSYSFSTGTQISSLYLYLNSIRSVTPVNIAISGSTSTSMISNQLPNVSSYNPDFVTVLIGGNDLLQYYENPITAEQLEANLETIAEGIKKDGRRIFFATIPDYNTMRSAEFCSELRMPGEEVFLPIILSSYNQKIAQVASNHNFTLVDLYPYLDQDDISSVDCIHPNLSGQQKIADRFKSAY